MRIVCFYQEELNFKSKEITETMKMRIKNTEKYKNNTQKE